MFHQITNKIKLALKYNKNNLNLIKIFLKINLIKIIKKNHNNINIIINNNFLLKNIKNLYKPSNKLTISYKELEKITNKKKLLIILSTNKGLITNLEAIKKKTSGVLITKLSF